MTEPTAEAVSALLAPHRARLDEIDRQLLDLLRDRLQVIEDVSQVKKAHKIPVMQHGRVSQIEQKVGAYAQQNGLSAEYLVDIYRRIIAESCRIEDLIIAQPEENDA